MPTFDELRQQNDSRALVRKIQKALAVLAPVSVSLPESLFDSTTGGLIDLKADGFLPVGMVTPDGYTFSAEPEKDEIDALGYASHIRSETTTMPQTITFTALERGRKHMIELTKGMSLDGVTQDAATGEIVYDTPEIPVGAEYRLLVIGADGPAAEQWILGKGYPRVKLQSPGEEAWGSEGAASKEITLDVFTDDELGTPLREYMGGTGAVKHKDLLGFSGSSAA